MHGYAVSYCNCVVNRTISGPNDSNFRSNSYKYSREANILIGYRSDYLCSISNSKIYICVLFSGIQWIKRILDWTRVLDRSDLIFFLPQCALPWNTLGQILAGIYTFCWLSQYNAVSTPINQKGSVLYDAGPYRWQFNNGKFSPK